MRIPALFIITLSMLMITGCETVMVAPAPATVVHVHPPLAPAHGYHYHYLGHDLEYDSNLGVYFVLGYDGVYFYNDLFLRFYAGEWQAVERMEGPWRRAEYQYVPRKLREHRHDRRNQRYSPPPHAPANGYRHHHPHGVDMVFDSGLGAYVVLGFDDLYFFDGLYLRFFDGYWHAADRYDGHWRRAENHQVPKGLWRNKRYYRHLRQSQPPLAPEHGYRYHYYDFDLVFDNNIGAYIVLGFNDLFFSDGHFLRFYNNQWQLSDRNDGRWRHADNRYIPSKLRAARTREKQGLYDRIKRQYRDDHQQERDYREKNHQHEKNGTRDSNRSDSRNNVREQDKNRNLQPEKKTDNRKGLFKNVKKQQQEKEAVKDASDKDQNQNFEDKHDTDENGDTQR